MKQLINYLLKIESWNSHVRLPCFRSSCIQLTFSLSNFYSQKNFLHLMYHLISKIIASNLTFSLKSTLSHLITFNSPTMEPVAPFLHSTFPDLTLFLDTIFLSVNHLVWNRNMMTRKLTILTTNHQFGQTYLDIMSRFFMLMTQLPPKNVSHFNRRQMWPQK